MLIWCKQVREIALTVRPAGEGFRWQSQAIQALQESTEAFLIHLFEVCISPFELSSIDVSGDLGLKLIERNKLTRRGIRIYVLYMPRELRLCRRIFNLRGGFEELGVVWDEWKWLGVAFWRREDCACLVKMGYVIDI